MRRSALVTAVVGALACAPSLARGQEQLGFRIRSWVDWDGQRIEGGQAYVGGPYGIAFTVKARFEDTFFEIVVRPRVTADSTRYHAWVETRQPARSDDSGRALVVFDSYNRRVVVGRTQAALLVLPLQPEPGESATLSVQIDGPFARPLEGRRAWSERDAEEPRGVRFSIAGAYPRLEVVPNVIPGSAALRVALDGSSEAVRVLAGGYGSTEFTVPGVSHRLAASTAPPRAGESGRCFHLWRAPPPGTRGRFTPEDFARWCVSEQARWTPAVVASQAGLRFRIQEIP